MDKKKKLTQFSSIKKINILMLLIILKIYILKYFFQVNILKLAEIESSQCFIYLNFFSGFLSKSGFIFEWFIISSKF